MPPGGPYVPAEPFRRLLEERYDRYLLEEDEATYCHASHPHIGPAQRLARELGWGTSDSAVRRLYRFRKALKSSKRRRDDINREVPTNQYQRHVVEDALHYLGIPFGELYPELAAEELPDEAPQLGHRRYPECLGCGWRMREATVRGLCGFCLAEEMAA